MRCSLVALSTLFLAGLAFGAEQPAGSSLVSAQRALPTSWVEFNRTIDGTEDPACLLPFFEKGFQPTYVLYSLLIKPEVTRYASLIKFCLDNGADARDVLTRIPITGIEGHKNVLELMSEHLREFQPENASLTLYKILGKVANWELGDFLTLLAKHEPLQPTEAEMDDLFVKQSLLTLGRNKLAVLTHFLDTDCPVYDCMVFVGILKDVQHPRLAAAKVAPSREKTWFWVVLRMLKAGRVEEAMQYVLESRRLGAPMNAPICYSNHGKDILDHVVEDFPGELRLLFIALLTHQNSKSENTKYPGVPVMAQKMALKSKLVHEFVIGETGEGAGNDVLRTLLPILLRLEAGDLPDI